MFTAPIIPPLGYSSEVDVEEPARELLETDVKMKREITFCYGSVAQQIPWTDQDTKSDSVDPHVSKIIGLGSRRIKSRRMCRKLRSDNCAVYS